MPRPLTTLVNNPDLITGIYNYCDRWCERCPLTSRCLVYATEHDESVSPESHDILNGDFWRKLNTILDETRPMIAGWAKQAGLDLNDSAEQPETRTKRKRQLVDQHPLVRAGKKYATAASDWFRELDHPNELAASAATEHDQENATQLHDAREVIHWYQYQIAVKTMRALSSRNDEIDGSDPADSAKDSDGSAKVVLIGVDRSIAAWRLMQLSLPDHAESIVPLILKLVRLRITMQESFPQAPHFIRPGFDDNLGTAT